MTNGKGTDSTPMLFTLSVALTHAFLLIQRLDVDMLPWQGLHNMVHEITGTWNRKQCNISSLTELKENCMYPDDVFLSDLSL